MNEKEVWLNKTIQRLLKTYGGRGKQLYDLCKSEERAISEEMTAEDTRDYREIQTMLFV